MRGKHKKIFAICVLTVAVSYAIASIAEKVYHKLSPSHVMSEITPSIPFGVSNFGIPVEEYKQVVAQVDSETTSLEIRRGCSWGNPGRNAYKGTIEQALIASRLPEAVQKEFLEKIVTGKASDRLEISNEMIRSVHSDNIYSTHGIKMTFGNTMCIDSKVNFIPGHVERADLYEVTDSGGITHSIMIPYVCGNISVLGVRAEADDALPVDSPAAMSITRQTKTTVQGVPMARSSTKLPVVGKGAVPITTQPYIFIEGVVPEPSTILLFTLGIPLIFRLRKRD